MGKVHIQELPEEVQALTPIVGKVLYAPIPFAGSDGRIHLVYELEATNFTGGKTTIEKLQVLDADSRNVVATLDAKEVASRLQPAGLRESVDTFAPSMTATIFLHVTFSKVEEVPDQLVHRLSLKATAASDRPLLRAFLCLLTRTTSATSSRAQSRSEHPWCPALGGMGVASAGSSEPSS